MKPNAQSKHQIAKEFSTDLQKGLSQADAEKRLAENGKNLLAQGKKSSFFKKLLDSFKDRMTLILMLAALISLVTALMSDESMADTFIILAIVVLNGIMSVIQENKAEKAISALEKMSTPHATVIRDGKTTSISKEDVVSGDIICVTKGDVVPADAYLIESVRLAADESALTGESMPAEKDCVPTKEDAHLSEMTNMIHGGTVITAGHGKAVVVATGMDTYMGSIAKMLDETEREKTPLQVKLAKVGGVLGNCAVAICAVIFIVSLLRGFPPKEMFLTSVSLAVAAIPEGLPAIVTVILSIGVKQMADKRAVVKKLPAVETLGTAAVICSDKTGTLTQNKMTVTDYQGDLQRLSLYALLCNNKESPTESALWEWGIRHEKNQDAYSLVKEIPFDSDKKYMITVHKCREGYLVIKKGAPEKVLNPDHPLYQGALKLGETGKRVLAFSYRVCDSLPADPERLTLTPCGICGMYDPPREGVKEAVKICRKAKIKPVMITGDHKVTAAAIAKDIGILREGDKVYTQAELEGLSPKELAEKVKSCSVFARTTPEFKVKIVEAYKYGGNVVAMTGDGVNDAPALKKADIGCAMGKNGTDVAKEASDIILTDDNFSTIIEAVRYGRGIYDNIRKAVRFLLSCNIGEILTVFVSLLLTLPSPLSAIQLLWINLVTDSLPAVSLGMEKVSETVMERKPTDKKEGLFGNGLGAKIAFEGIIIGLVSLCGYIVGLKGGNQTSASTMCFGILAFSQLLHTFNMRSEHPFYKRDTKSNLPLMFSILFCGAMQFAIMYFPKIRMFFGCGALDASQWLWVAILSFMPIAVCEGFKLIKNKK